MDRLILGLAALSVGSALLILGYYALTSVLRYRRRWRYEHLRGARLGPLPHTPAEEGLLTLAGVPIPRHLETRHVMLTGTTGSGKTVALSELLSAALARGDRAVIVDPGGQFLSWFYDPARDMVLNPFDSRSPGWTVYNEIRGDYDYDQLARSIVPDPIGGEQWNHYAQQLFIAIARALGQRGQTSTEALLEAATARPLDKLADLLAGTPAAQLTEASNARMAGSVRAVLATYLAAWKYLSPGDFSLREFLADERQGSVFITWREDQTKALKALMSTWLDILIAATLSLAPDSRRRVWLFIDELGTLGRLSSLQDALTKGRKFGLCGVLGFQTIAQLADVYGPPQAQTLLANLGTPLFLRAPDAQTSDYCSNALGEREIIGKQHGHARQGWLGLEGHSRSTSYSPKPQRLVLPSELQTLPDLHGYLTFPGDYPVAKVQLTYVRRETRHPPFIEPGGQPEASPSPKTLLDQVQEILST